MNEFDHLLEQLLQKTAGLELSRVIKLWMAYRKQLGHKNPWPQRAYEEAWTTASVETNKMNGILFSLRYGHASL